MMEIIDHPESSHVIVLITGDSDYAHFISSMKLRHRTVVLLAPNQASQLLKSNALPDLLPWEDITQDRNIETERPLRSSTVQTPATNDDLLGRLVFDHLDTESRTLLDLWSLQLTPARLETRECFRGVADQIDDEHFDAYINSALRGDIEQSDHDARASSDEEQQSHIMSDEESEGADINSTEHLKNIARHQHPPQQAEISDVEATTVPSDAEISSPVGTKVLSGDIEPDRWSGTMPAAPDIDRPSAGSSASRDPEPRVPNSAFLPLVQVLQNLPPAGKRTHMVARALIASHRDIYRTTRTYGWDALLAEAERRGIVKDRGKNRDMRLGELFNCRVFETH
jgi:hypothetical protein